jgi:hypothetical protein
LLRFDRRIQPQAAVSARFLSNAGLFHATTAKIGDGIRALIHHKAIEVSGKLV